MWILSNIIPVLKLYFVGLKVLLYQLFHKGFTLPVLPKQNGKVAIVTGGARGLGYETVRQLTDLGVHVIIASRNETEGLAAVKKICEKNSEAQVDFEFLDVASLRSVRCFVRRFKERRLPLHVLINSAAVMLVPEGRTEDEFETHFATNYLGHFLLTRLLLDSLVHSGKDGSCSRVVSISSSAHYAADARLQDLLSMRCSSAHAAYARSKLAQVLFTYRLHHVLRCGGSPVTATALDPGLVDTGLYERLCRPARLAQRAVARLCFKTPAEGAAAVVFAAVSPDLEGVGGCYLYEGQRIRSSAASYDEDLQAGLWRNTCDLLDLQDSLFD
ncbi:dehydrogenase/reductase SDR family member on chromosome X-like isoform X2 [Labeo rohita]|uniref:dehydrogenase/reductase SDR family member on chromosome X-like isoform X2 n=1 Tax=Labeo rohita TaxID=84645 RepID=UPI0021E29062|nr:dehydrogenase/reductase SDR family member on chromosome X-like isoform X2 [Labeo rohita]